MRGENGEDGEGEDGCRSAEPGPRMRQEGADPTGPDPNPPLPNASGGEQYHTVIAVSRQNGVGREKVPPYQRSRHGGDVRGRSYFRGSKVGTGRDRDV